MALNDIYKVDLISEWQYDDTVTMRTTFFYQCLSSVATAANRAAEALEEDVLPSLVALAPPHVLFMRIDAVCLVTPTDYHSIDVTPLAGTRVLDPASDPAASFLCVQFVSNRAGPGTRNGRKRFSFLYEADIDGNSIDFDIISEGYANGLASVMAQTIAFGSIIFAPVVVEHPVELGLQPAVRFVINEYNLSGKVSTQNTRKS